MYVCVSYDRDEVKLPTFCSAVNAVMVSLNCDFKTLLHCIKLILIFLVCDFHLWICFSSVKIVTYDPVSMLLSIFEL